MSIADSFDFIQMVRIEGPTADELGDRKIALNKFSSRLIAKARRNTKRDTCYLCGKKCSSFCNSHSIPEFTLRSIDKTGKVIATLQNELPFLGKDTGVNKAGTFHIICNECDNTVFKDYEKPEAYSQVPTDKMLAQIALKDYLRMISLRNLENEMYRLQGQRSPHSKDFTDEKQFIGNYDLQEFQRCFNYAQKALQKADGNHYYLCFYALLDYVVPYATQSPIVLISDFEDNVVNNVYNFSPNYKQEYIHVVVFPLEGKSVVLLFWEEGKKRYRKFGKQLKQLPLDDQLAAINYIVFAYTENAFIEIETAKQIQKNEVFMDLCKMTADYTTPVLFGDPLETAVKSFSLSKRSTIPNLLSKEFAIK